MSQTATLILTHGQIHTLDRANPLAEAVAIADGKIVATGSHDRIMSFAAEGTQIVDLKGHTVIPGLNDSHLHLIRGGLNYNLELRWEGVPSLADALRMLKDQADRTPSPQWVRVVGGWSEFQFAERRMPTLEELNEAAPDTPVFVLHLYDRALLKPCGAEAVGYTKETPDPAGGEIVRDSHGNPTGMLIAKPKRHDPLRYAGQGAEAAAGSAGELHPSIYARAEPTGLTSAIDAGGGFQNYPEDYEIIEQLHAKDQMTVRIAYNLFTQRPEAGAGGFRTLDRHAEAGAGD
ncbi:amidohydrolase family protein [Klebsiella pneumoniae]|uniref:amidohydrolase family protein n=1 Tax=Klebsiella pneumoniae TaxID=573 RepID=UPI0011575997|nr:amidohydrolase family protein [Klebsiella pneumoniae]